MNEDEPRTGPVEYMTASVYIGPDTQLNCSLPNMATSMPPFSIRIGTSGGLLLQTERPDLERLHALIGRALEQDAELGHHQTEGERPMSPTSSPYSNPGVTGATTGPYAGSPAAPEVIDQLRAALAAAPETSDLRTEVLSALNADPGAEPVSAEFVRQAADAFAAETARLRTAALTNRLRANTHQKRADQLAIDLMAFADNMRTMAGQYPDDAAARNAFHLVEQRIRDMLASDRARENASPAPPVDVAARLRSAGLVADRAGWVAIGADLHDLAFKIHNRKVGNDVLEAIARALTGEATS